MDELRLLGGFRLIVTGTEVPVQLAGQKLLALLALRGPCPRAQAAGVLCRDADESKAMAGLRTTIWRLRRAGVALTGAGSDPLRLPATLRVDAHDPDAIVGAWRGQQPPPCELLPGWYDDWVLLERELIRQRLLHALEALSVRHRRAGRGGAAVEAALQAVIADPLRESARRVLIEAHLAEGNWVEGRRAYTAYASLLDRELGVRPGRALAQLLAPPRDGPAVLAVGS